VEERLPYKEKVGGSSPSAPTKASISQLGASWYVLAVLRTLAIVALIMLVVLLAVPLGIGMAMGHCPDCAPGTPGPLSACVALLVTISIAFTFGMGRVSVAEERAHGRLATRTLERPP
jgi:hypothetical protein